MLSLYLKWADQKIEIFLTTRRAPISTRLRPRSLVLIFNKYISINLNEELPPTRPVLTLTLIAAAVIFL